MNVKKVILVFIVVGSSLLAVNLWLYFQPSEIELAVANWMRFGSSGWLLELALLLTDTIFSLAIGVFLYALWMLWKSRYISAILLTLSLGSLLLIDLMKSVLQRPRPVIDQVALEPFIGTSFPSGHAFVSLLLSGVIVLVFTTLHPTKRREGYIGLVIAYAAVIGWTRIFLQAHYPSDVLGGYILASFFLLVFGLLYRWLTIKLGRT